MLDTLFLKVLDMTAKGSLVILAVILVRLLLKKAPKIFSYTLWGVVLLRLLCPFSIQLPVSVLPEMESATETYRFESDPITVIDAGNAVTHVIGEASSGNLNTEQIYVDVPSALGGSRPMAATLWEICIMAGQYIWLMGMLAVLLHSLTHYFLLRKKLIGAMHLQGNIWLADHIPSPFVMGIIKPRIYLPAILQERELEYIIAHEQHHIRRGDHIVKLLAFIALAMHWFNPLVWLAYLLFCKDMEMSCDEAVVKKMGVGIRADYAASLLRFATGRRIASTSPLAFGEGDTKSRIQNLAKWKKPVGWILKVCALVCAVTVVCLLADPTPRAGNVTGSTDPKTETTLPTPIQWTPIYNDHSVCGVQVQSMLPEGVTKRDLTAEEIAAIVPGSLLSQGETYGYVYFLKDGSLYYLALRLESEGRYATVLLGNDVGRGGCCISVAQENYAQQLCQCGDVEYALFRDDILIGVGRLNGIPMLVRMDRDPEQDQPIFESILENFARYQGTSLSLSNLKP